MKLRDPNETDPNPQWDLDQAILDLPQEEIGLTLRDAVAGGFLITGNPGTGKSSSTFRTLIIAMLRLGAGGVIFSAKPNDTAHYRSWGASCDRQQDIIEITGDSRHCCDAFAYEDAMSGGNVEGTVQLPRKIRELMERGKQSKSETFFVQAEEVAMRNSLTGIRASGNRVSMSLMAEILNTAPKSPDEVWSKSNQQQTCQRILDQATARLGDMTPSEQRDFKLAGDYFFQQIPGMNGGKTLGCILMGIQACSDLFIRGQVGDIWASESSFVPDLMEGGGILLHGLDPKSSGEEVGLTSATVLKTLCQRAAERRGEGDGKRNRRPLFIAIDEAQLLLSEAEASMLATCRSAGVVVILATQNISGIDRVLSSGSGSTTSTDTLLGLIGTHIIHRNTDVRTCEYYSSLIGSETQWRGNVSGTWIDGSESTTAGASESYERSVPAHMLSTNMRCGGPANDFFCDAVLFSGGRTFNATGKKYLPISISQK